MNIMQENEDTRSIYNKWLDGYNDDHTQPSETPSAYELQREFPELNKYEADRIVFNWLASSEKELGGG